jgi:AcrR family transcriptional regulator
MSTFDHSPFVLKPQQERSRIALAKIVSAATSLLAAESGGGEFSMADVAKAAQVPVASLYRRFRSKDDLLQAIKLEATARIEGAILDRMARERFESAEAVVSGFASAAAEALSAEERLHRFLFSQHARNDRLEQVGWDTRSRIFGHYRDALRVFLRGISDEHADIAVRVSFHILSSAFVGKARSADATLADFSWPLLLSEFGAAAIAYLQSTIEFGHSGPD